MSFKVSIYLVLKSSVILTSRQYTNIMLYNQLKFYSTLFDQDRILSKADKSGIGMHKDSTLNTQCS